MDEFIPMMKVRVNGQLQDREIDYVDRSTGLDHPMLNEGEEALFVIGDMVPMIVKMHL